MKQGYFEKNNIQNPDLRVLLDLVALGTVADVVKLDQNNRILVNEGIKRCLLYTSPSPRDQRGARMPSSA